MLLANRRSIREVILFPLLRAARIDQAAPWGSSVFVARRYLTARRKQAFISVITLISVGRHRDRRGGPDHRHRPHHRLPGATSRTRSSERHVPRHGLRPRRARAWPATTDMAANIRALARGRSRSRPVVYGTVLRHRRRLRARGAIVKGIDFERDEARRPAWLQVPGSRGASPRADGAAGRDPARPRAGPARSGAGRRRRRRPS
ncbi:MAG: hypothetical protein M0C28_00725 [Candidatus Moduliflexus flocculans]|nr:hypothetical protein [Candidatus Moduliflexus flocculans]